MIVSHAYKFIYLRTEKTASTSITTALEPLLEEGDVVYGGFTGAWRKYLPISPGGLKRQAPMIFGLHAHASASQARMVLGKKIFDSYFKFSVEREPWDRQLSLYAHRISKEEKYKTIQNFDADMRNWFWRTRYYTRLKNWGIYAIGNRVVADQVIQYTNLEQGLIAALKTVGFHKPISLPRHRESPSGDHSNYAQYYSHETRDLVAKWYHHEIREFGYEFKGVPLL